MRSVTRAIHSRQLERITDRIVMRHSLRDLVEMADNMSNVITNETICLSATRMRDVNILFNFILRSNMDIDVLGELIKYGDESSIRRLFDYYDYSYVPSRYSTLSDHSFEMIHLVKLSERLNNQNITQILRDRLISCKE